MRAYPRLKYDLGGILLPQPAGRDSDKYQEIQLDARAPTFAHQKTRHAHAGGFCVIRECATAIRAF